MSTELRRVDLKIESQEGRQIIDITDQVTSAAQSLGTGLVLVSAPHTTVALLLTELDGELGRDYLRVAETLLAAGRPYEHIRKNNPNTEAHILSTMFGTSRVVALDEGALQLGTYQRIVLFELDGPKTRTVTLSLAW